MCTFGSVDVYIRVNDVYFGALNVYIRVNDVYFGALNVYNQVHSFFKSSTQLSLGQGWGR